MLRRTTLALVLALLAWPATAQDFKKGMAAYKRSDYATAIRAFRPIAEQGYAKAQFILGVMYSKGQGVPQDYAEVAKWYRKAAEQGNAAAQSNLGDLYRLSQGVPEDYAEAVKLYRKAAVQGKPVVKLNGRSPSRK